MLAYFDDLNSEPLRESLPVQRHLVQNKIGVTAYFNNAFQCIYACWYYIDKLCIVHEQKFNDAEWLN